jgi:hypothetical protein
LVNKSELYRVKLRQLDDWTPFLLRESGLPGPRGNLELAHAVAAEGDRARFRRYLAYGPDQAPTNSPYEFLVFCGLLGLGRLVAEGEREHLATLRRYSNDPRWRMREAVAMALQWFGREDMAGLLAEMTRWVQGAWLEQRAAMAALCEPALLGDPAVVGSVLQLLDGVTAALAEAPAAERKADAFKTLRQGLGYCWSVAVSAAPDRGCPTMERWLVSDDRDVRWIMKTNLGKKRLARAAPEWVADWRQRLGLEPLPT